MRNMRKSGVTMIELLVAIAILMVLSGLVLSGLNVARSRARNVLARRDIGQLTDVWRVYYGQYGRFPNDFPGGISITESGQDMVAILRGPHAANPHGTPFMDFHSSVTNMVDPWKNPYRIVLDENYDGEVSIRRGGINETLSMSIGIWSAGSDGLDGTSDDVLGWESSE